MNPSTVSFQKVTLLAVFLVIVFSLSFGEAIASPKCKADGAKQEALAKKVAKKIPKLIRKLQVLQRKIKTWQNAGGTAVDEEAFDNPFVKFHMKNYVDMVEELAEIQKYINKIKRLPVGNANTFSAFLETCEAGR